MDDRKDVVHSVSSDRRETGGVMELVVAAYLDCFETALGKKLTSMKS